ncbi:MAG: trimeric intracellular cation channel family protein, partial [Nitrosopumilus sp.]|nr:trimeric intracellular cation channel family protein [Nitrosopumilus sp.]
MTEFSFSTEFFIYVLDLFGTIAFAITGAFKAIEKKFDFVGILLLATITGVAGGTIRDVVLGRVPNSIADPTYVIVTIASGIVIFFLYSKLKKHWNLFLKFDAIGLGVFTIIGATFAYNIFGLNFLPILLAGILTAVGGGILRDVFVNQSPIVFVKEFYLSASFI